MLLRISVKLIALNSSVKQPNMPLVEQIEEGESRIGIWQIDGTEYDQLADKPDELKKLYVKHPRTHFQRIASRLLLAEMVGEFPVLEKDQHGKPLLPNLPWDISISHTEGYAVIMLGKGKIGVDVQHFKPNVIKVRDRFLDDRELELAQDIETTTLLWAAKEAVYKYNAKPGLDFKDPITIHSVEAKTLPSNFVYEGIQTDLELGWKRLDGAMLVWTI